MTKIAIIDLEVAASVVEMFIFATGLIQNLSKEAENSKALQWVLVQIGVLQRTDLVVKYWSKFFTSFFLVEKNI